MLSHEFDFKIYKNVLQDIDIKLLYSFLSLPTSLLLTNGDT